MKLIPFSRSVIRSIGAHHVPGCVKKRDCDCPPCWSRSIVTCKELFIDISVPDGIADAQILEQRELENHDAVAMVADDVFEKIISARRFMSTGMDSTDDTVNDCIVAVFVVLALRVLELR